MSADGGVAAVEAATVADLEPGEVQSLTATPILPQQPDHEPKEATVSASEKPATSPIPISRSPSNDTQPDHASRHHHHHHHSNVQPAWYMKYTRAFLAIGAACLAACSLFCAVKTCTTMYVVSLAGSMTLAVAFAFSAARINSYVPSQWKPPKRLRLNYCQPCRTFKPQRAHHCRSCQRCVKKMDHHCPVIGNCVAFNNHGRFLTSLFFAIMAVTASTFCVSYALWDIAGSSDSVVGLGLPFVFLSFAEAILLYMGFLFSTLSFGQIRSYKSVLCTWK
jgi:hypothetical protein